MRYVNHSHYINRVFDRDVEGGEFQNTEKILDELGVVVVNLEDYQHIRDICKAVSERAAFLASAGKDKEILYNQRGSL